MKKVSETDHLCLGQASDKCVRYSNHMSEQSTLGQLVVLEVL